MLDAFIRTLTVTMQMTIQSAHSCPDGREKCAKSVTYLQPLFFAMTIPCVRKAQCRSVSPVSICFTRMQREISCTLTFANVNSFKCSVHNKETEERKMVVRYRKSHFISGQEQLLPSPDPPPGPSKSLSNRCSSSRQIYHS